MATLESQYNKFLFLNPGAKLSFNEWKKVHGRLVKQALVNMMKADEELGLYDEPFRHKVEIIPAEEILANRSNAYEFIDFDKQETLNEVALEFAKDFHEMYETSNLGSMHFGFIEGAKWQAERSYNEEEVIDIAKQAFVLGKDFGLIGTFNEWFEQFKKK
jgi:hypothetical protein